MMVITLTQERQVEKLMYMESVQCTVLEVKVVEGLGHTVDVVLVNGTLKVTNITHPLYTNTPVRSSLLLHTTQHNTTDNLVLIWY